MSRHHHYTRTPVAITVCLLAVCLGLTLPAAAQDKSQAAADAETVRPFVSETTILLSKVDFMRLELPDLKDLFDSLSGSAKQEAKTVYSQISGSAAAAITRLREVVKDKPVYATIGIPVSRTRSSFFFFVEKPAGDDATKLLTFLKQELKWDACIRGGFLVATPTARADVKTLLDTSPPTPREGVADAFTAVGDYPIQILLIPPRHVRRTVKELAPTLPSSFGGGSSSALTEGLRWAALGIDPARLRTVLTIQSDSEAAARDLATQLPSILRGVNGLLLKADPPIPEQFSNAVVGWVKPTVEGDRVLIRIDGLEQSSTNLQLLATVVKTLEGKMLRRTNMRRFKQIMLGMHNYHDVYKRFPPHDKYRDDEGRLHLSWRVHILPFIEELQLYKEFHLDEPWDSPHNKKLIARMPDMFKSHSFEFPPKKTMKPGHTTFLAPLGKDTIMGGSKSTRFRDIRDGTSNTVALVEVKPDRAVPWTAPDDYAFDAKDPGAGLTIGVDGRWLSAFADGSVRQLRENLSPKTILALFGKADGQAIDYDDAR